MKIDLRVTENGKTFAGEVVLTELRSHNGPRRRRDEAKGKLRPDKPSAAIDGLYTKGYFAVERTLGDSIAQLGRDGYNFSAPSILMALKSREFLQRRGNKGSYRFIQKYPPTRV